MKNVQITVDEETLAQIDKAGRQLGLKRSQIVREALGTWLRRQAVQGFEQAWIAALGKQRGDNSRADDWLVAQAWEER